MMGFIMTFHVSVSLGFVHILPHSLSLFSPQLKQYFSSHSEVEMEVNEIRR